MKRESKQNLKQRKELTLLASLTVIGLTLLSGCGKSKNTQLPQPVIAPPIIAPGPGGIVSGGCIPINQPITFNAQNIYFGWANIVGGRVPMSQQQVGTVVIGGGVTNGQYSRAGVDGTISMNINPSGAYSQPYPFNGYNQGANPYYYNGAYPQGNTSSQMANAQGTITINPDRQRDILWKFGNGNGINNTYFGFNTGYQPQNGYYMYQPGYNQSMPAVNPGSVCVSQVAFDLGHYHSLIYGGRVFLFLNNSDHGYILYF